MDLSLNNWLSTNPSSFLWWRDDDLCEPTESGNRLLRLALQYKAPISLAVIPEKMSPDLAPWLFSFKGLRFTVLQHGFSHRNLAPDDAKKCELTSDIHLDDLLKGKEKLSRSFPQHFKAIMVPPWNRVDASLLPWLKQHYEKISVYGPTEDSDFMNVHYDVMKDSFNPDKKQKPLGLMSHHLVHQEHHWQKLEGLFQQLGSHRFINLIQP